jgi:glycosyltransferase involved in cell wall biosynthesis
LVERPLNSINAQTYTDFEIIIVDDGSVDDTYAAVARYQAKQTKFIRPENIGFTKSLIKPIEASDSKYIAIVGSRDVAYPSRFAKQARYLDESVHVAVVGVRYEQVSEGRVRKVLQKAREAGSWYAGDVDVT